MIYKSVDVIKEQVFALGQKVQEESEDLDYIINKIETSIDFVTSQVYETIRRWKNGEIYHRSTFEDLKFKFRLDTFSIDDGWELFFMYPDWIRRQREKLLVFIRLLGTETDKSEAVPDAIARAEQAEWAKDLDMDMDVIFVLREIRRIYGITVHMEPRLKELATACRRRSQQIIKPEWEPKGTL